MKYSRASHEVSKSKMEEIGIVDATVICHHFFYLFMDFRSVFTCNGHFIMYFTKTTE